MWGSGPQVSADRGSFAAGRDINIQGIPPEQWPALLKAAVEPAVKAATDPLERLNAAQRDAIVALERQLGSTQEQILSFFRIIGEAGIAVEAIPGKLVEIANRYQTLVAQAAAAPSDDPETARLKVELHAALERVDLDRADALLAEILAAQDLDIQSRALQASATCAQRGDLAMTRLRYREAAEHFHYAANRVPESYETERINYLTREATALYLLGDEFGDSSGLKEALKCWYLLVKLCPRKRAPLDWATMQNNLGNTYFVLGERGNDVALRRAVAAYEKALGERTRERTPLDWAATQNNLGTALSAQGERGDDFALHQAVRAYEAALEEYTRERAPLDWAMTKSNLGATLRVLGERGDDAALGRAVEACEAALGEYTRERAPLNWGRTQTNLGAALSVLGERGDEAALRRAVDAYEAALGEYTRARSAQLGDDAN